MEMYSRYQGLFQVPGLVSLESETELGINWMQAFSSRPGLSVTCLLPALVLEQNEMERIFPCLSEWFNILATTESTYTKHDNLYSMMLVSPCQDPLRLS
jgi:hypothetical protein